VKQRLVSAGPCCPGNTTLKVQRDALVFDGLAEDSKESRGETIDPESQEINCSKKVQSCQEILFDETDLCPKVSSEIDEWRDLRFRMHETRLWIPDSS
jgi:hypothetical protein